MTKLQNSHQFHRVHTIISVHIQSVDIQIRIKYNRYCNKAAPKLTYHVKLFKEIRNDNSAKCSSTLDRIVKRISIICYVTATKTIAESST